MARRTLIDAGPIVAFLVKSDRWNRWAADQFRKFDGFSTCEAVVAEACARLAYHHKDQSRVLELVDAGVLTLDFSLKASLSRVKNLMEKYRDREMDLADACLVAMTETAEDCKVITTDINDFKIYRRFGRDVIPIVTP
jgi:uncharacterized protein